MNFFKKKIIYLENLFRKFIFELNFFFFVDNIQKYQHYFI